MYGLDCYLLKSVDYEKYSVYVRLIHSCVIEKLTSAVLLDGLSLVFGLSDGVLLSLEGVFAAAASLGLS